MIQQESKDTKQDEVNQCQGLLIGRSCRVCGARETKWAAEMLCKPREEERSLHSTSQAKRLGRAGGRCNQRYEDVNIVNPGM